MNDKFPNLDELSLAAKLRACADGELKGDECEQLRAYIAENPDAVKQMGFEKELRSCCERVLTDQKCCPDALRAKITAMCGCSESDTHLQIDPESMDRSNEQTRTRSFWMRSSLISAAAAVLVITAGVLVFQAINTQIEVPAHLNLKQARYIDRVGDFVVREHNRCCDDDAAASKLIRHDLNEAAAYFSEAFNTPLAVPDMSIVEGSVEFYGGGDCHVPSTPRSGHLRFDATNASGDPIRLSLFISPAPARDLIPLEEGTTYVVDSKSCSEAGAQLFAWMDDGIMYLLVSEAPDPMCSTVRRVMRAPTNLGRL